MWNIVTHVAQLNAKVNQRYIIMNSFHLVLAFCYEITQILI